MTTAALACSQSINVSASEAAQLADLIANFYANCGNTTVGITMTCTNVNSYVLHRW